MNKTQKIARLLFYSEIGLTSKEMKGHGIMNPSSMISLLKSRYEVNVQDYTSKVTGEKRFYIPPTSENIQSIKQNIDFRFQVKVKDRMKMKNKIYLFMTIVIVLYIVFKIIKNVC